MARASWDQVDATALGCGGANARSRAKSVSAIRSSAATPRAPRRNPTRRAGAICAVGSSKGLTVVRLRSAPVRTLPLRTLPTSQMAAGAAGQPDPNLLWPAPRGMAFRRIRNMVSRPSNKRHRPGLLSGLERCVFEGTSGFPKRTDRGWGAPPRIPARPYTMPQPMGGSSPSRIFRLGDDLIN